LESGFADLLVIGETAAASIAIVRHPTVAMRQDLLPKQLKADRTVVVVNHPPRWFDGKRHYDLNTVARNLSSSLGHSPDIRPNSPVISRACEELGHAVGPCWYNIFDVPQDIRRQRRLGQSIVIGRHSRDHADKWPEEASDLRQAYPEADDLQVAVMGGAATPRKLLGKIPANWIVHPFSAMPVWEFLKTIDVYVYFHHKGYTEAFARAPSEAIISGLPTILPRSLEPLFGDACLYREPPEVLSLVRRLQEDPAWYDAVGRRGRARMIERFGARQHLERLRALGLSVGQLA
jgi:hypothetical protein